MSDSKLPSPEEVEMLYHEEGMYQREIAEEFDVNPATVSRYMRRHEIETDGRNMGRPEIPEEDVLDDIIAGRFVMGMWPRRHEYSGFGDHSPQTVLDRFGTWNEAIEAAKERLEENRDEWAFVEGDTDV